MAPPVGPALLLSSSLRRLVRLSVSREDYIEEPCLSAALVMPAKPTLWD
jgi:hypothetical protein